MQAGIAVLTKRVSRIAQTDRLRVSEERAADPLRATGTGTVLALLQKPYDERDSLSSAAREAEFAAIPDEQSQAAAYGLPACGRPNAVMNAATGKPIQTFRFGRRPNAALTLRWRLVKTSPPGGWISERPSRARSSPPPMSGLRPRLEQYSIRVNQFVYRLVLLISQRLRPRPNQNTKDNYGSIIVPEKYRILFLIDL